MPILKNTGCSEVSSVGRMWTPGRILRKDVDLGEDVDSGEGAEG